ncbi:MAG: RDD family protein [Pseudohongiellaceae bacterium]|nr:RDD family protein [Pseudohongiellaceae bacterium]
MSQVRYAGFNIRLLASLIDSVLITLLLSPLLPLLIGEAANDPLSIANIFVSTIIALGVTLVFWKYRSATPGKIILGLKIIDEASGGKPSSRQLVVRYLSYYVSLLGFGLGFLLIPMDTKKRGWHDKIAGTLVIYDKTNKKAVNE